MIDSSWGSTHLERKEILSGMLKETFRDELFIQQLAINWLPDWQGGKNLLINSIGELTVDQMSEGTALPDRRPDTGQYVFNINEFVGIKAALTDVFFEDDYMAPQVLSALPERMTRAFNEYLETQLFKLHRQQTTGSAASAINGAYHRFTANGSGRAITLQDLAYVRYAFKKANVTGPIVGIVDPSFEFNTNIISNITSLDNNPQFQGIIETGIGSDLRFIRNIYGIDIYVSNYLDNHQSAGEALLDYQGNSTAGAVTDVANIFFAAGDKMNLPFIGSWLRRPSMKSWNDEDKGIEYHQMSARFGLNLYRPENLVTMISSTTLS